MAGRSGVLALVALLFAVDCDGCRKKELSPAEPKVDETALAQQRAEENRLAEQRGLEQQRLALEEQQRAQATETANRERSAKEAADQQRSADKIAGKRSTRQAVEKAPHKVLAAQQDVTAVPVAPVSPGPTTLHFRSDAGLTFRLLEAHFLMDGSPLPVVIKAAERGKSYLVASNLGSGQHTLTTQLTYQGATQGVFDYMKGYKFKVTSDEMLSTTGAQGVSFTIVCKEKAGLNTPLEKRLFIVVEGHHTP